MYGNKSKSFRRWVLSFFCVLMIAATATPLASAATVQGNGPAFVGAPLPQEGGGDGFTG